MRKSSLLAIAAMALASSMPTMPVTDPGSYAVRTDPYHPVTRRRSGSGSPAKRLQERARQARAAGKKGEAT